MKNNLLWTGMLGIVLSICLHFVRPVFEYVTPTLIKIVLYAGFGILMLIGILGVLERMKEFLVRMKN